MLIQALADYADRHLGAQLADKAWDEKPVPWMVELSAQGRFLSVVPRMTTVTRGKKQVPRPLPMGVARSPVNRNSGEHPLLGTDDILYVLGEGAWTTADTAERARGHHAAFVEFLRRAADETKDPALVACVAFYGDPDELSKAREALREARGGELVALSVNGPLLGRPAIRDFWRRHYSSVSAERLGTKVGECIVSGERCPIAPTHEKIKGTVPLGGRAEVLLMSFDKEAFRSYGWDRNENSPVSPDRALAYVLALNDLLGPDEARKGTGCRRVIGKVGFLAWLRAPEAFDVFNFLYQADPAQVAALLSFDVSAYEDVNSNQFYLVGLSGNGGRLRVRYWVTESLSRLKQNLAAWHEGLRVAYPWDEPPVRFWQLLLAVHPEGKPPAHHSLALLRRAIEGQAKPLGFPMLALALNRLRHPESDRGKSRQRGEPDPYGLKRARLLLGLVRMCLNDIAHVKGELAMSQGLDPDCTLPAYVCGRLMAEFESLQRTASASELNSSIVDRYFALASTYPAAALPKIELLAQKHLRKLRRDNGRAAAAIESRIRDLHSKLQPGDSGAFPGKLSLEGQGLFALGYYHQKAWSVAQALERKQATVLEQN